MIDKLIKIFVCFAIAVSFGQENNTSDNSSKYINVVIEGMHCAAGCAKSIENKLNLNDGIVALVSFENSQAIIEYDSQLFSDTDILNMINNYNAGKFSASLLHSNQSTCSKGSKCCQKTGKLNADCDNKKKGCCSSSKKECKKK